MKKYSFLMVFSKPKVRKLNPLVFLPDDKKEDHIVTSFPLVRKKSIIQHWLKAFLVVFVIFSFSCFSINCGSRQKEEQQEEPIASLQVTATPAQDEILAQAYRNHSSEFFVESSGVVEKVLSDDVVGSRHQRFILRLATNQTLLIIHNIDIAPRIEGIQKGDYVRFRGEYLWNDQGGIIHWTHRDLLGRKSGGWLECRGRRYQ